MKPSEKDLNSKLILQIIRNTEEETGEPIYINDKDLLLLIRFNTSTKPTIGELEDIYKYLINHYQVPTVEEVKP